MKLNQPIGSTSDTKFACFLLTCGFKGIGKIPPLRKEVDPAKNPDKKRSNWTFDGKGKSNWGHTYREVMGVWKQGIKYIEKNPDCPLSQIMGTLKNYQFCLDAINSDESFNVIHKYRFDGKTFLVREGSKKHKKLIEKLGY